MPTIKVTVDENAYARLVQKRRAAGLPNVPALFLQACGELSETAEAQEICSTAVRRAERRDPEVPFLLRDLFTTATWSGFSKGARLRAGKIFNARVLAGRDGIFLAGKSASNHQLYVVRGMPSRRSAA